MLHLGPLASERDNLFMLPGIRDSTDVKLFFQYQPNFSEGDLFHNWNDSDVAFLANFRYFINDPADCHSLNVQRLGPQHDGGWSVYLVCHNLNTDAFAFDNPLFNS